VRGRLPPRRRSSRHREGHGSCRRARPRGRSRPTKSRRAAPPSPPRRPPVDRRDGSCRSRSRASARSLRVRGQGVGTCCPTRAARRFPGSIPSYRSRPTARPARMHPEEGAPSADPLGMTLRVGSVGPRGRCWACRPLGFTASLERGWTAWAIARATGLSTGVGQHLSVLLALTIGGACRPHSPSESGLRTPLTIRLRLAMPPSDSARRA
jgi:hypothetical protein